MGNIETYLVYDKAVTEYRMNTLDPTIINQAAPNVIIKLHDLPPPDPLPATIAQPTVTKKKKR